MSAIFNTSTRENPEFVVSATELLQSMFRAIIIISGVIYAVWHILATMFGSGSVGAQVWLGTGLFLLTWVPAFKLYERHYLAAQIIWQAGLTLTITFYLVAFQAANIAFYYALLPLMVVVTVDGFAGVLSEGMVVILVGWLSRSGWVPTLTSDLALVTATGGAIIGLVGWAASRTLFTATQWSLNSLDQARKNMEEARQHRAQLARVFKDLDQAYYRLERANAELLVSRKTAEDAERFKAEIVAIVSHELRTPLNLIVGFSEMMVASPESYGDVNLPGHYRSDLNAIYRSAQHMLALVDDILDMTRIEVGKIALTREMEDLGTLIAEATAIVKDYIAVKGLELVIRVPPDLPSLWIDRLRIRQVLLNLLVNAARFTEQGSIAVTVSRRDEEILVQVTDTGHGIAEKDRARIFEEFYTTGKSHSPQTGGSGLGLPISKKFVELHGGRMGVESTAGQGSTFYFALPISAESVQPFLPTRRTPAQWRGAERMVIVVNDDPHTATLLQRYLEGYQVIAVPTHAEAIALADQVKALAVVSDLGEPIADRSQALWVNCSLPSARATAAALGASDLLVKPIVRQDLIAAIERLGRPVRRVLLTDDDPEVVRLYQRMLSPIVSIEDCLEAFNGEEAWQLLREEKPDLIILDLMMPEMDGYALLKKKNADPELVGIPVIIASAKSQDLISFRLPGPIQFSRADGFQMGETVRVLESAFKVLAASWHPQNDAASPIPGAAPVA